MWEGDSYQDNLEVLKENGVFPPCWAGLTDAASYDMTKLICYAFEREQHHKKLGPKVAEAVVRRIRIDHKEPYLRKYIRVWAQSERNLRFLQWLICKELSTRMEPSATEYFVQADVIDFVTMELIGKEFQAPGCTPIYG